MVVDFRVPANRKVSCISYRAQHPCTTLLLARGSYISTETDPFAEILQTGCSMFGSCQSFPGAQTYNAQVTLCSADRM